jgi:hypothetical protein
MINLVRFGFNKSYDNLRGSFYWPNENEHTFPVVINANGTNLLHPLPVSDECFTLIAIDFVGPLPQDEGYSYPATITDRLGAGSLLIPCHDTMTAEEFARLFINHWFCDNGCPREIITDWG